MAKAEKKYRATSYCSNKELKLLINPPMLALGDFLFLGGNNSAKLTDDLRK